MRRWLLGGLILLEMPTAPGAAGAQVAGPAAIVVSEKPDDVSVTLYRDPNRSADRAIVIGSPSGFALITERRTVRLPAGPAVIRFEGVAGNILPESAIVANLPRDVLEKNLDADLLSPRSLYDRMLGRRVLVRRTDRATGKIVEQQATIRSSAEGAALVEIAGGIEALNCTGLAETIVYPELPAGLSPKPTLSIQTDSPRALTATLTLSYLAGGFDWQADYIFMMRPDGRGADLFAWITLASSDVTSFAKANAAVVAGRLNRVEEDDGGRRFPEQSLSMQCFPTGADYVSTTVAAPAIVMSAPAPPVFAATEAENIIVTGSRIAKQEELGDLKLYRFPGRVTVASQAQKQVAFLADKTVPVRTLYVSDINEDNADEPHLALRFTNRTASGLGVPLPAGTVQVFQQGASRPLLLGTSSIADKAVGEDVEYRLEAGPGVSVEIADRPSKRRADGHFLTVSNANPWPIEFEARLASSEDRPLRFKQRLVKRDGRYIWAATVPANGTATFDYELEESDASNATDARSTTGLK